MKSEEEIRSHIRALESRLSPNCDCVLCNRSLLVIGALLWALGVTAEVSPETDRYVADFNARYGT
jgi:hypothetical protein